MSDSEIVRIILEGIVAAGVIGGLVLALLKLGGIGNQIEIHGKAIEKMADVIVVQATQKLEIAQLRQRQQDDAARTDASFGRVFAQLDRIQERWQGKRTDSSP